jgi:hypothetical protein
LRSCAHRYTPFRETQPWSSCSAMPNWARTQVMASTRCWCGKSWPRARLILRAT